MRTRDVFQLSLSGSVEKKAKKHITPPPQMVGG